MRAFAVGVAVVLVIWAWAAINDLTLAAGVAEDQRHAVLLTVAVGQAALWWLARYGGRR